MNFKEAENNSQCYEEGTGLGSQRCSRDREEKTCQKLPGKAQWKIIKKCPLTLNIMVFTAFSNRNCGSRHVWTGARLRFRNDQEFRNWKQQVQCIEHIIKKKGEGGYSGEIETESRDWAVLFVFNVKLSDTVSVCVHARLILGNYSCIDQRHL